MKTLTPVNRLKWFREKLSTRVFIIVSINMLVMTAVFIGFFLQHERSNATSALIRKGELLSRMLANNSRLGIFSENKELLTGPVAGILQDNEVSSVSVFALSGKMLITQEKLQKNSPAASMNATDEKVSLTIKKLLEAPHFHYSESGTILEFWAPVNVGRAYDEENLFLRRVMAPYRQKDVL